MFKVTIRVVETMVENCNCNAWDTLQEVADDLAEKMTFITGGATVNGVSKGVWLNDSGEIIKESGQDVWALAKDQFEVAMLRTIATQFKVSGKQDAVLFIVEPVRGEFI